MSIVRRLAALLDHPLALRSCADRGSVFAVTVPLIGVATPPASGHAEEGPEVELQGVFVIVVDDEAAILEGMRVLLEQFGARALCARSGPDAVAALAEHLRIPDLIISDYRLAGDHDGIDAIRMIRESQGVDMPALIITGESSSDELHAIRASGLPVLFKPASAARLRSAIVDAIGAAPGDPTELLSA